MVRPGPVGGRAGRAARSEITWLGTRSAIWSNHQSESWVRIRPLSGMSLGSTQSKAEVRSLATMTSRPACIPVEVTDLAGVQVDQAGHLDRLGLGDKSAQGCFSPQEWGSLLGQGESFMHPCAEPGSPVLADPVEQIGGGLLDPFVGVARPVQGG